MSVMLHKKFPLSSNFTMDEEAKAIEKQGIVSILGSSFEKSSTSPSLRRTLSADMSSRKWLAEKGFSPVKKISSSHELLASINDDSSSTSSSDDDVDEDEKERLELWRSITGAKMEENREQVKANEFTNWASILSQKGDNSKPLPPPYVHPLVKRSASSMSDKSLQICTESLGSETGSDGFSSYPSSEADDAEDDRAEESPKQQALGDQEHEYALPPVKYRHYSGPKKEAKPRAIPPPLPSLSQQNGASLLMRSSRNNGRLVLEAVSVSSQTNFQAQRHDGRLILTFVKNHNQEPEKEGAVDEDEEEPVTGLDEESVVFFSKKKIRDENQGREVVMVKEKVPSMPSGVINLHKLALMMNKPIGLQSKFNEVVNKPHMAAEDEEEYEPISIHQSLSIHSQVASRMNPAPSANPASSFNAYEYFWRSKPTSPPSVISITKQPLPSLKNYSNTNTATATTTTTTTTMSKNISGRNDIYYAGSSMVKSCNEQRRSMVFWEPNCIATS
ncbi:hypothetical protein SAY86_009762 [Trapa natans]|uniref:FAF domain-containing protein n=1 Tax=Trapa natans TaxID=22666 RepID=A0AAN7QQG8_TRANT|nr:hypothetical protein SAY86_009762 [Trapa natans]